MKQIVAAAFAVIFILAFMCLFRNTLVVDFMMWSIAIGIVLFIAIGGLFFVRTTHEEFMRKQASRKEADYDSKAKKYLSYKDGFGMMHLLNLDTDVIENLSAFPGTHHNGIWQDPHPAAATAWYALINKRQGESPVKALLPEPQKQVPNLFSILSNAERVLVKGPSDSGKTTLFQTIVRQSQETVLVVDPHYKPGLWPDNCKVVGAGRNHDDISRFLDWLSTELDRRYQLRAQGNEGYEPLTIIIDEWMSISTRCENATKIITEMITESRKSKMKLFIGSHSDQVEALGIRGQGKLREGLLIVRLYYDQVTSERRATFDYGQGERDCSLYEPMVVDDKDTRFVELVRSGQMSRQDASQEVYGKDNAGAQFYYTRRLLGESSEP